MYDEEDIVEEQVEPQEYQPTPNSDYVDWEDEDE